MKYKAEKEAEAQLISRQRDADAKAYEATLAIWAFLRICSTLSIPMFSMVPAPSLKFWMLK